jgi:Fe-S oxidoreductase
MIRRADAERDQRKREDEDRKRQEAQQRRSSLLIVEDSDFFRQLLGPTLGAAGFEVRIPAESHLCCGSAGVYNILQSEIATRLRDRKADRLNAVRADVIAAGNVGCAVQLAPVVAAPVVHPVELLDWASGGPRPAI